MSGLSLEELNTMMGASPFITNAGMKIVEVDTNAETLAISMSLKPEFERSPGGGQFHGGPLASLIDTAGCFDLVMVLGHGVAGKRYRQPVLFHPGIFAVS